MGAILQDLHYALRMIRRNPGFAAFAVLTLALGIGINTTVFTFTNALLLRPIAAKDPDQLLRLYQQKPDGTARQRFSYPDYLDYRDRSASFVGVVAVTMNPFRLEANSQSEEVLGEVVTRNYFGVLGLPLKTGQPIVEASEDSSAIISERIWRNQFSWDPRVTQKTIRLNGRVYDIAGVMDSAFNGTFGGARVDVWIPIARSNAAMNQNWQRDRATPSVHVLARLKPGVDSSQAESELTVISAQLEQEHKETNRGIKTLVTEAGLLYGNLRKGASVFFTALILLMGLVLLIACSNLANLLITRAISRRREFAIRMALGARPRQLTQQLFLESLVIALLGGVAGFLVAKWSANLLISFWPVPTVPVQLDFSLDPLVLLYCFAITLMTAIFLGVAPAMQSRRQDTASALKEDGSNLEFGKIRAKHLLVIGQISLSLLLLICSGLFIRSWRNAQQTDTGIDPQNMLALDINLADQNWTETQGMNYYAELKRRISALPGVRSTALTDLAPVDLATARRPVQIQGHTPSDGQNSLMISSNTIGTGYFETVKLPILRGRDFSEQDVASAQSVVIINEAMQNRYWPKQNPVGQQFFIGDDRRAVTIIGIAKNAKYRTPGEEETPHLYLPFQQFYEPGMSFLVRTESNPKAIVVPIQREMTTLHKEVHAFFVRTMEEHLAFSMLPSRVGGSVLASFGLLGLILACIGLYAAISSQVVQRKREIGIRMAVGATSSAILGLFVRHGLRLTLIGSVIGVGLALAATTLLSSLLVNVTTHDPLTFTAVPAFLIVVSLIASAVPAYRASKSNPLLSLRS